MGKLGIACALGLALLLVLPVLALALPAQIQWAVLNPSGPQSFTASWQPIPGATGYFWFAEWQGGVGRVTGSVIGANTVVTLGPPPAGISSATFAVQALDATGAGPLSYFGVALPVSTVPPPPPPAGTGSLTLSWVNNDVDPGLATGIRVDRRESTGTYPAMPLVMLGRVNTYVDLTPLVGVTYCYRVIAFNAVGASPPSNEACAITPAPSVTPTPPISPSNLQIS